MAIHPDTASTDVLALQAQLAELQERLAAAEARAEELTALAAGRAGAAAPAEATTQSALLHSFIDALPTPVYAYDTDGQYVVVNTASAAALGRPKAEILGRGVAEIAPPEQRDEWLACQQQIVAAGEIVSQESMLPLADGPHTFVTTLFPVRDAGGTIIAIGGISGDITDLKRSERERERLHEEIIQAQAAALAELSTPLIPLNAEVVVMPLVGTLDSRRAQQVIETLLEGIAQTQAGTAIIDITGVPVVDTQVANGLIRAAQAVKLLGAQVVLTGIRPEVAQTLVGLGADLSSITTAGSLQAGIAYAMGRR